MDEAAEVRASSWRRLAALHQFIESRLERALQAEHGLSVVEFRVLDALSRQDGSPLRMAQLADAAGLSPSASTRLVNRLEARGLLERLGCLDDRRGVFPELTAAGRRALERARPVHDNTLEKALVEAGRSPDLSDLVRVVTR